MKFWLDAEFIEDGRTINLISIGLVAEDGREYYAETELASMIKSYPTRYDPWIVTNVAPHLTGGLKFKRRETIATEIIAFVGDQPEFWAYYADYDWVVLCQLYGRMIDLPKGWPMFCRDIKQRCMDVGNPSLPKQEGSEHNALADARWNRTAFEFLQPLWEKRNG